MTIRIEKALDNQEQRYKNHKTIYLTSGFRHALANEYSFEAVDIGIDLDSDEPAQTLWLPGYQKKIARQRHLVIGAGFDKTGLTEALSSEHLIDCTEELRKTLNTHKLSRLELRTPHNIPCQTDHSDKVELSIQLDVSCEERLRQFSKSTRRNLRLPFKHGFRYTIDRQHQQLEDFYQLYLLSMHTLGSLAHSRQFFEALWRDCHDQIEIFVGYMDDQPVVASFHFISSTEIYGAWGCAHPNYKKYSLFLTMLWLLLQHCEESGQHCYNLGRTSKNSNSYHFKKRLANREQAIHYYRFNAQPEQHERGAVYSAASWLIRKSPPQVMQMLARKLLHRFY